MNQFTSVLNLTHILGFQDVTTVYGLFFFYISLNFFKLVFWDLKIDLYWDRSFITSQGALMKTNTIFFIQKSYFFQPILLISILF